jgi:hypothetical protein
MDLIPDGTPGWRIGAKDGYHLDVIQGRNQTRIVLQEMNAPPKTYTRYWCYVGDQRDLVAVAAARAWLVLEDDEPLGFYQSWNKRPQI